jgi:tetratricopeptide (TPR) repeat protein
MQTGKFLNPAADPFLETAVQYHQAGRLPDAELYYRQVLQLDPDHPDALHLLGTLCHQTGNNAMALELIHRAIRIAPQNPLFYNNLGAIYQAMNRPDAALECCRQAVALAPGYAEAHFNLGNVLARLGRPEDAAASYRQALAFGPDYADACIGLGNALKILGRTSDAAASYQQALAINPNYAEAHFNLGCLFTDQDRPEDAALCYQNALALRPNYAEAHYNLGMALQQQGRPDEAAQHYRQAVALRPDYADAHAAIADLLIDAGQFEAARDALNHALAVKPDHPVSWAALSRLKKMTPADRAWLDTALGLLAQGESTLSPDAAIKLHFALGKYYDDTAQYDAAFPAYRQAHLLKLQAHGATRFDRAEFSLLVDTLIANYSADFIGQQRQPASPSARPVLVVGMPRSGTTLLEQIIASHPDAFGAGELNFWWDMAQKTRAAELPGRIEPALIAEIAGQHEQCLQRYSGHAARVVDKKPNNFLWLGFIHTILPQARIIHIRRNPADTCLSIYFQDFTQAHSYSDDLEDLAYYYREYARLIDHWRKVLPADRFMEISYEALIDDQAQWSKRVITFVGLPWDERCLDFHKTERNVATPSNWQVRQKIYSSSKARWRHYEKHLGVLLGLLDMEF